MFSFTDPCLEKTLSLVTYSPFGNYIAAGAINGQMLVWDVEKKNTVSRKKLENEVAISGLKWHPSGKDLAFCDVEGHLGLYE
ncbi:WD repeat and HMG-box DNA-binding protein 1, partial [Stegodyphus mimosarum]